MILQASREHLVDDLKKFPAEPDRGLESHAVTNAQRPSRARQIGTGTSSHWRRDRAPP